MTINKDTHAPSHLVSFSKQESHALTRTASTTTSTTVGKLTNGDKLHPVLNTDQYKLLKVGVLTEWECPLTVGASRKPVKHF